MNRDDNFTSVDIIYFHTADLISFEWERGFGLKSELGNEHKFFMQVLLCFAG